MRRILIFPALLALSMVGCDEQKSPTDAKPSASADSARKSQLAAKRTSWKARWRQPQKLAPCKDPIPADRAKLCDQAIADRVAFKKAEMSDAPAKEHLTAAATAAYSGYAAAASLKQFHLQRLMLKGAPTKKGGADAGADAAHDDHDDGHDDHKGHAHAKAKPSGDPGKLTPEQAAGVAKKNEPPGHSHGGKKDPVYEQSLGYMYAERDALLRVVGYLRFGERSLQEQAFTALEKHGQKFPKSRHARQQINEAILLLKDPELNQRLRKLRKGMGPGTIPGRGKGKRSRTKSPKK